MIRKTASYASESTQRCLAACMGLAFMVILTSPAFATDFICATAVAIFMNYILYGLSTLAVILVGVGALVGKVSWGMAITVAVGIAVASGANAIVLAVSSNSC